MFRGTNNILQYISHIQYEWWNIPQNSVGPTEHSYGSEQLYVSNF